MTPPLRALPKDGLYPSAMCWFIPVQNSSVHVPEPSAWCQEPAPTLPTGGWMLM